MSKVLKQEEKGCILRAFRKLGNVAIAVIFKGTRPYIYIAHGSFGSRVNNR